MAGKTTVGVLAMQGAFIEHEQAIKSCGANCLQVRRAQDLQEIDALIIPGGESTTMGKLLKQFNLLDEIKFQAEQGMPIWGTCAGMILMAKEIVDSNQIRLGLMNIEIKRNAYGRQVDSFETDLEVKGIGTTRAVFIRAPYVQKVWGDAQVLASYEDKIVMVRENNMLATAFHPELTRQKEIQEYFLQMI
ncbi:MAG: pyridoxal 5'-phosphate synthase glutaminase subunit PdxT [Syntrophomonadaceae bacterium]|nr:pyridoxal 5'-phosphate synthase glutaminase subunit PdxT [Syntrophomonadaceae bacterium]